MTDSLFNLNEEFQIDPNLNYLNELVGDGKKFKSPEDLAKGKAQSDAYIKTLESRMDEMRRDLMATKADNQARANLEDLLDQHANRQKEPNSNITLEANKLDSQPKYDPKQIEDLVQAKIRENEAQRKEQENFKTVMGKLRDRYGANYVQSLKEQTEQLGLEETFVNDMARKHPTVFLKTFGLDQPVQQNNFITPPRNAQRNDNFSPTASAVRTRSWYLDLKKKEPATYYDPKTSVQMHKDAEALGEAFFDVKE